MGFSSKVQQWRDSGKHLPEFLRDFHDQKDLFKTIHETTRVENHSYCKEISWITGQCYVIDIFLWAMARYGYTLQKTRTRLPFEDLEETKRAALEARDAQMARVMGLTPLPSAPPQTPEHPND